MLPKWAHRRPEWSNLSVEKLKEMSHYEIEDLIKKALRYARDVLLDGPEKKLTMKLGQCALRLENLHHEHSTLNFDQEELDRKFNEIHKEVMECLTKLFILSEADSIKKQEQMEVVEVTEELGPDPWTIELPKTPEKVGNYNPWKELE